MKIELSQTITKREYFAAQIMCELVVPAIEGQHNTNNDSECECKAGMAVRLADALIKALDAKSEGSEE